MSQRIIHADRVIPLTRPYLGTAEVRAVARVLRSGWLAQGPEVEALEQEFATYVGARGACAVSSATAALHLALRALGVGPGDEVIVPSHTFIATVNAVLYCGAIPVFADVNLETYCVDKESLAPLITPRTACIVIVHQMGIPCDLSPILDLAARYGLPVVEDAACALGSEYLWNGRWELIGKPHGHIACFSFHPRKIITCGEGGMVTCHDPQLLDRIRKLRQHGLESLPRPGSHFAYCFHAPIVELGYNYRLSDVAAAILRCQLSRLPKLIERRRYLAARYHYAFRNIANCEVLDLPYPAKPNYQSYPLRISADAPISRDMVIRNLAKARIESKPGIMNVHEVAKYISPRKMQLPRSEILSRETVLLPLYSSLSIQQQDRIITIVRHLLTQGVEPCVD